MGKSPSWPLEDHAEAIRHQLPLLDTRAALEAWLADKRTVRLRDHLRFSPEHRGLWLEIEAEIAAALAWAAPCQAEHEDAEP